MRQGKAVWKPPLCETMGAMWPLCPPPPKAGVQGLMADAQIGSHGAQELASE